MVLFFQNYSVPATTAQVIFCRESRGDVISLVEHPESMSHASMPKAARHAAGITEGNIRVSVGIESKADLTQDMTRGLELS